MQIVYKSSLLLVAFCLLLTWLVAMPTGVDGLKDEDFKYEVEYLEAGARTGAIGSAEIAEDRWVRTKLANGTTYDCLLPDEVAEAEKQKKDAFPVGQKVPPGVSTKVHDAMRNLCFNKVAGWWIYEACWNVAVRQFHQNQNQVVETEYFLGKGPVAVSKQRIEKGTKGELVYGQSPLHGPYVSTKYYNGSVCDINGQQRHVEVRAACGTPESPEAGLSEVQESETCTYVVLILNEKLCSIPELQRREAFAHTIRCFERDVAPIDELDNSEL